MTEIQVSSEQLRSNLEKCFTAARKGPVAVRDGSQIKAYLISPDDYEEVCSAAIRKLLKERMKGPTISQQEARDHIEKALRGRERRR
jgi:PHD/YefM family antitoxin component YafN of YafNO toxin-antitoxin module